MSRRPRLRPGPRTISRPNVRQGPYNRQHQGPSGTMRPQPHLHRYHGRARPGARRELPVPRPRYPTSRNERIRGSRKIGRPSSAALSSAPGRPRNTRGSDRRQGVACRPDATTRSLRTSSDPHPSGGQPRGPLRSRTVEPAPGWPPAPGAQRQHSRRHTPGATRQVHYPCTSTSFLSIRDRTRTRRSHQIQLFLIFFPASPRNATGA